ncbi:zf-HC2 domain-containing protein [Thauera sp.]|uniref:zf-HC2 domain-containing protein n=1 Tax=Thauera sp. TaxID=1905334 RepID=UPI00258D84D8|nr:zf-HC2 domain-containing protein [Thauera sp.]
MKMMDCKDVTRLISERYERTLSLRERLSLKVHTAMCIGCTNYGKHMDVLRKAMARLREGQTSDER